MFILFHCVVPKRISSESLDYKFTHSQCLFSLPIGAELLSLVSRQDLIACQSKQFSHAHGKPYNNILSLETSTKASIWATWLPWCKINIGALGKPASWLSDTQWYYPLVALCIYRILYLCKTSFRSYLEFSHHHLRIKISDALFKYQAGHAVFGNVCKSSRVYNAYRHNPKRLSLLCLHWRYLLYALLELAENRILCSIFPP